jgi:hypothetical protein
MTTNLKTTLLTLTIRHYRLALGRLAARPDAARCQVVPEDRYGGAWVISLRNHVGGLARYRFERGKLRLVCFS